ncbi:hypothetical protein NITLEN_10193 [Nitrospira lenta]|uniref:Uncharacterized protein n=1 Tax=Nitrospira lenta TaxID=1436998 RepID=A0A330L196_9BACT|nr:hypothetical protein NITLEN_10193 [Nitrospira lenta]
MISSLINLLLLQNKNPADAPWDATERVIDGVDEIVQRATTVHKLYIEAPGKHGADRNDEHRTEEEARQETSYRKRIHLSTQRQRSSIREAASAVSPNDRTAGPLHHSTTQIAKPLASRNS